MERARIRFEPDGVEADVAVGMTVHEAAAEAGVLLEAPCGGLGRCGSCRVRADGGLAAPRATEREALSPADVAAGIRLACLARVGGPATITRVAASSALRVETAAGPSAGAGAPVTAAGRTGLGVAVDLGTTSIAVALHDLAAGGSLGTASALNPQVAVGHDVMTRVSRALAGDADALRRMASREIEGLIEGLLAAKSTQPADIIEMVVVGNPTMVHLLLGRDVTPLAAAPYDGALVEPLEIPAAEAGFDSLTRARLHVGPAVSAFVGSDVVAGMVATHFATREYPTLLLDLGTNGELVLRVGDTTVATSAAAGPAFEGMSISDGMRAEPGAIERVSLEGGDLRVETVAGGLARGLCGSGLLDTVAVLLDAGVIDATGLMSAAGPLAGRVSASEAGVRFEVAPGVHLTQQDVRQVQLAKGAVVVATDILLEEAGVAAGEIREVLIGGGFGSRLRPASLVRLGIVAAEWAGRITFCGNTALAGASAMLLDKAALRDAALVATGVRTIPLATRPDFERRFLAALGFPTTVPR